MFHDKMPVRTLTISDKTIVILDEFRSLIIFLIYT